MAVEFAELGLVIRSDQAAKATRRLKELGVEGVRAERAANRVGRSFDRANRRSVALTRSLRSLLVVFVSIAAARQAIRTMADFEQTMATVRAVTRATDEEFARLTNTARDLGATTRFTASQAGEGLLALSRAGLTAVEAVEAVPRTLQLAQAGLIALGDAAQLTATVMRQYNLEADQARRITDSLIIVSNRSATNVQEMGDAFKFVGPVAGAAGRSLEETAAAIGTLGNAGLRASLAGTSLRAMIVSLVDPTAEARRTIEAMGLSLDDVNPALVDLATIFDRLSDAGLNAENATQIFTTRAFAAALTLAQNTDKMRELIAAQNEFAGEAERVATMMDQTLAGAIFNLKSAWEALILAQGDRGAAGSIKDAVKFLTQMLRILAGVEGAVQNASESALGMTEILATVAVGARDTAAAILEIVEALANLGIGLSETNKNLTTTGETMLFIADAFAAGAAVIQFAINGLRSFIVGALLVMTKQLELWLETVAALERKIGKTELFQNAESAVKQFRANLRTELDRAATDTEKAFDKMVDAARNVFNRERGRRMGDELGKGMLEGLTKAIVEEQANKLRGIASALSGPRFLSFILDPQIRSQEVNKFARQVEPILAALFRHTAQNLKGGQRAEMERALGEMQAAFFALTEAQQGRGIGKGQDRAALLKQLEENISNLIPKILALAFAQKKADDETEKRNKTNEDANRIAKDQQDIFADTIEGIRVEKEALQKVGDERERFIELKRLQFALEEQGQELTEKQIAQFDKEFKELQNARRNAQLFDDLGRAAGKAFEDIIVGARNAREAVNALLEDLARILARRFITEPLAQGVTEASKAITQAVSGIFSARGNVFNQARVVPMASGGIIDQRIRTQLADGRTAEFGDGGPEVAIAPLTRTPEGRLGIEMVGGGKSEKGGNVFHFTFNFPGSPDIDSFRQSLPQIENDFRRMVQGF